MKGMRKMLCARAVRRVAKRDSRRRQAGVTAIEYALIAALIAVAIVSALTLTGGNLETMYTYVSDKVGAAISGVLGP